MLAPSTYFDLKKDENGKQRLESRVTGVGALRLSQINKGAAFTVQEREALHLTGVACASLLPSIILPNVSCPPPKVRRFFAKRNCSNCELEKKA